jgi:prepilin-type N-terminal cleavage/methylation domain-containing protein
MYSAALHTFSSRSAQRIRRLRAFSLIELVIVIVIIGVLAAIAVPRLSRGASAAGENALAANLSVIRNGIEMFAAEHGQTYPAIGDLTNALTQYSNLAGTTFGARDVATGIIYGPYVRTIPALSVGAKKGETAFVAALGGAGGWVYTAATGTVTANCADAEVDGAGKKYNTY